MMKNIRLAGAVALITLFTAIGCKRTLYSYPNNPLTNYYLPLEVGKYAIYQLDSLNFYYYGQLDTMTRYLAKDTVENSFIDNQGRTAWVVVRYLSPAAGPTVWTASETKTVTPTIQSIEEQENNLRFIKLAYPMKDSFTWNGNSYLPDNPYQDYFTFSTYSNMGLNAWTYTYLNVDQPFTAGGTTYDSTLTVLQYNDSTNVPIVNDTLFASETYWSETYAKHVGLVYRHTSLWEYQPRTINASGYKIGFEVTFTLIEHN
ncbi:MAG TPA: hypothetical protein VHD83_11230 [Puia sp.]|nr:hypothetical protein [Puia sp.]